MKNGVEKYCNGHVALKNSQLFILDMFDFFTDVFFYYNEQCFEINT